jgi:hypothetical protein
MQEELPNMESLDINIHKRGSASIMDPSTPMINLAENKWTPLFDFCNYVFEAAYFIGDRTQFLDDDFEKTIEYLAEEVFVIEEKYRRIIFKIKPAFLHLNRSLLNKLWIYYEYPSLIYLGDERDEEWLINAYKHNTFHEDIVEALEEVLIFNRLTEENVIWVRAGFDVRKVLSSISSTDD